MLRERFVQAQHGIGLQQFESGHRQLATQIEQLMLDHDEQLAQLGRQRLGEQHAEMRIELVDIAHRGDAKMVFSHPLAVAEAGRAVVAGAGRDLRQSIGHDVNASPC